MAASAANPNVMKLSPEQEQKLLQYSTTARILLMNQYSLRSVMEQIDREYMRENDYTQAQWRAKLANRAGDARKMQDVTVPIIMPQVRAALAYMSNVFLTGYPIFDITGDTSSEVAAMQLQTILGENAITASWARQLMLFFNDGLKYNLHGIEVAWEQRNVAAIETDATAPNSAKVKDNLWHGNVIRRMDLYNTFFDPRVHPSEIHSEGEYAGYLQLYSRIRLKKYINDLFPDVPTNTVIRAFESNPSNNSNGSSGSPFAYYQPTINPFPIMQMQSQTGMDWLSWAADIAVGPGTSGIRYSNVYEKMRLYMRILPADFNFDVPAKNTPQIFKLEIINGQVVILCERQTNAHNYLPIIFGQPLEDGLDYQTKSFASNVSDLQSIASSMWNGYIASKRRLVSDRVLYDPLRVRSKDINNTDPAAKIPVRPGAYGKPVGEAVYQFPFRDEQTNSLIQGADAVNRFADRVNNQNPAQQGQFVKGNKTLHEYEDVMGHGNSGNQTMAIMTENQVFTPAKEILLLNMLQFQQQTTLYNRSKQQQVAIKPEDLRVAAVQFKVSDGLIPVDKMIGADEFQTVLQTALQAPKIGQGIDVAGMFAYLMQTRGVDLTPFLISQNEQQYNQQIAIWQGALAELSKMASKDLTPDVITALIKAQQQLMATMPQPSPQLQQEQQAKQQGSAPPTAQSKALASTTGNGSGNQ